MIYRHRSLGYLAYVVRRTPRAVRIKRVPQGTRFTLTAAEFDKAYERIGK